MKRNQVVVLAVIVALGLITWAGVANYRRRSQQQMQIKIVSVAPVPSAPPAPSAAPDAPASDSPDVPFKNPLADKQAPAFTLKDTTGKKVSLADYKGKAVVVDFWATWCAPCKIEIPWLEKLHDQYASQGLVVLGISEDDLDLDDQAALFKEKQEIARSASKLGINYPVLIDDKKVSEPYGGVDALPTTFFVDRNGKVVAATVGLVDRDELEANIKKALGSGEPAEK
ncbi:MAG TPA: TlpA disulfide reductase family protein, partial [Silvibacterium sp.]|nr:TlpA disulfide reductase family protein [Silvibacterium sp.]